MTMASTRVSSDHQDRIKWFQVRKPLRTGYTTRSYLIVSLNQTWINDVPGYFANVFQTTNPLIARPLSGSPNCAW